jgi:hypothetical protein
MQIRVVIGIVIAGLALARGASADAPPPPPPDLHDKAAAAAAGEEALGLFEAGRWREAFVAFQRADALYHAPTLVLYMAHCQKRLGRLAAARGLYRRVAAEPLPPGVPHQFLTAQAIARGEAERLKESVATIKIVLQGPEPARVRVTVDGDVVLASELAQREVEPGDHVIEATPPGTPPERRTVKLKQGTSAEVLFTFPEASARALERPQAAVDLWTPGVIGVGVGATGIGLGAITGVMSLSTLADVRARCRADGHCLASDQARARSAGALGDASTAALVLGGLAAASGAVMLYLHSRGEPRTTGMRLDIGPGYAGLGGEF